MWPTSWSRFPAITSRSSSVNFPHFSRTLPFDCFHFPCSWSQFIVFSLLESQDRWPWARRFTITTDQPSLSHTRKALDLNHSLFMAGRLDTQYPSCFRDRRSSDHIGGAID